MHAPFATRHLHLFNFHGTHDWLAFPSYFSLHKVILTMIRIQIRFDMHLYFFDFWHAIHAKLLQISSNFFCTYNYIFFVSFFCNATNLMRIDFFFVIYTCNNDLFILNYYPAFNLIMFKFSLFAFATP